MNIRATVTRAPIRTFIYTCEGLFFAWLVTAALTVLAKKFFAGLEYGIIVTFFLIGIISFGVCMSFPTFRVAMAIYLAPMTACFAYIFVFSWTHDHVAAGAALAFAGGSVLFANLSPRAPSP